MKRNLTLIIVDDEQSAIDHALTIIQQFIDLTVIATFTDSAEALKYLRNNHVDFVLLDVEMPRVDGVVFALQMPPEVKVIFCTAHSEYAVEAFDREAVDYLMKPIRSERLAKAMAKMKNALMIDGNSHKPINGDYYYFMIKGPIKFTRTKIDFDEIVYIEVREERTHFFLISDLKKEDKRKYDRQQIQKRAIEAGKPVMKTGGEPAYDGITCSMTLQDVNKAVRGSTLMQIHKSFILNTDYFRSYRTHTVELVGLKTITLPTGGRKNYPEFFEWTDDHNTPTN